jgi:hypothetical protein
MSMIATLAPSLPKRLQMARPMPLAPPVTAITLPSSKGFIPHNRLAF